MKYFNNIKKQYLITFLSALIFAFVIERLFWQERGMNVQMVVYAEIIFALTVTLFEIPSGVLADKFGRKKLIIWDSVLGVGELAIILFAQNFWHFAIAVFLAGIGNAFSSGAANALTYESLLADGREDEFEKIMGRLNAIQFTGYVIAALSGSLLANFFSFEFNYILSICSLCIAFVLTLTLKEPPQLSEFKEENAGVSKYVKEGLSVFKSKPLVFKYCFTGAVLGACIIYLDEFWQIVAESVHIPLVFFGLISAASLLLRVPGSLLAYKLREKYGYNRIFNFIIAISAFGYAAVFLTKSPLVLVPMMVLFVASGIVDPLVEGFLHKNTESHVRATTESFSSLILRVVSVVVGLPFGYISAKYSIFAGFIVPGVVCLGYLVLFWRGGKNKV